MPHPDDVPKVHVKYNKKTAAENMAHAVAKGFCSMKWCRGKAVSNGKCEKHKREREMINGK